MAKQIYKVDHFHGGLNSSADPRDIGDSEFADSVDIMFDNLGRLRTMGGTATHDAPTKAVDITPGYGLFTFSHDRQYGHLGEHLNNTADFSTNWAGAGGGWTLDSTDASYAHSGSPFDLKQVASSRREVGIGGIKYVFKYTMSGLSGTVSTLRILGGSGEFAASNIDLEIENGTHNVSFVSSSNVANNPFTIDVASQSGASFNIDNVSLMPYDTPSTGDDYLVLSDDESNDTALYVYSRARDTYGSSQHINIGSDSDYAPVFYYVDGALRVCDSNFGKNNSSIWYGFVNRNFFPNVDNGKKISEWVTSEQSIQPPLKGYFDKEPVTIAAGENYSDALVHSVTGNAPADFDKTYTGVSGGNPLNGWDNVWKVYFKVRVKNTGGFGSSGSYRFSLRARDNNNVHKKTVHYPEADTAVRRNLTAGASEEHEYTMYFDVLNKDINVAAPEQLVVEMFDMVATGGFVQFNIDYVIITEGVYDASAHTQLTENSSWLSLSGTGTGTGWDDFFHTGTSFVVDGSQETRITTHDNPGAGDGILQGLSATNAVDMTCYFKWDRLWNKRITGINIYLRKLDAHGNVESQWYKQATVDFITGFVRTVNGVLNPIQYDSNTGEYYAYVPNKVMTTPMFIESYQTSSGISEDAISTFAKFKTAVVANRMAYVGNVEIEHDDGRLERKGDAILKSPVNRFDIFPSTRIIEASVQDGDEIVKLEEYADRLLQFKKGKMELINISQDLEFLEDTFVHKGVSHQAATCKTDFGIAWVNPHGCYLYDGKQVHNILEKQGRQIIHEDEWDKFLRSDKTLTGTRLTPMIGYLPKKRQLIIYDDISNNGTADPRMYLYDMVTRSWTKGAEDANRKIDIQKTNFTNDWNGDLIYAYDGGVVVKWDDASDATDTILFKTKDIDLGQPGQLKKIYKVYVSYKGDGSNVVVEYSVDGDTGTFSPFYLTTSDGSSDKSTSDTTCLLNSGTDKWVSAELIPVSSIDKVNSFQLKFSGTAAADFEINDISIVYRLKKVK